MKKLITANAKAGRKPETIPVHLRIADLCRDAIFCGEFRTGDRFPSERELADRYDVSRATSNKVISTLVAEGHLILSKGIGAHVCEKRTLFASLAGMESFTGHILESGLTPSTIVLQFKKRSSNAVPAKIRKELGLSRDSPETLIYLERLRLADGEPMILESRWVRESLAPGLTKEDVSESFYRILEDKFQLAMTGEHHSISASLLDESAAEQLRAEMPSAALCVEGTGFVKGTVPLWYQRLLYHGDRYELFNQTLGRDGSKLELRLKS